MILGLGLGHFSLLVFKKCDIFPTDFDMLFQIRFWPYGSNFWRKIRNKNMGKNRNFGQRLINLQKSQT